jgi:hypothetical protein
MLTGFALLTISILERVPESAPLPTISWDKEEQELEISWYFGDGNYVQVDIDTVKNKAIIYLRCGNEADHCDYSSEKLAECLDRFVNMEKQFQ